MPSWKTIAAASAYSSPAAVNVATLRRRGAAVGAGSVEKQLDADAPAGREVAPETLGDHQGETDLAGLERPVELGVGGEVARQVETPRGHEGVDEITARRGEVTVAHPEGQVLDVEADGVAEDHQHEGGQPQQHHQRQRIAPDLPDLLERHGEYLSHCGCAPSRDSIV